MCEADYPTEVLHYFRKARTAYEEIMEHVRRAFIGVRVEEPWWQPDLITRTLARYEADKEDDNGGEH